jgi:hypothetical protein
MRHDVPIILIIWAFILAAYVAVWLDRKKAK